MCKEEKRKFGDTRKYAEIYCCAPFEKTLHFKTYLMKNNLKFLFTVITLIAFQLTIFAQKPNYTGTWILNFEKSKLEHQPQGLTSKIFMIKQDGDNFSLTRYNIFGDKKKK